MPLHPLGVRVSNKEQKNPMQHVFYDFPKQCNQPLSNIWFSMLALRNRTVVSSSLKNLSQTWIENNIQMISQANRKNQVVRWNRTVFASGMHEASCCFVSISPAQQRAVALKKKIANTPEPNETKSKGPPMQGCHWLNLVPSRPSLRPEKVPEGFCTEWCGIKRVGGKWKNWSAYMHVKPAALPRFTAV